jgi:hypothetical protein
MPPARWRVACFPYRQKRGSANAQRLEREGYATTQTRHEMASRREVHAGGLIS